MLSHAYRHVIDYFFDPENATHIHHLWLYILGGLLYSWYYRGIIAAILETTILLLSIELVYYIRFGKGLVLPEIVYETGRD